MNVFVQDLQTVPEVETTLFQLSNQGDVNCGITLENVGSNKINYRVQKLLNGVWTDLGSSGSQYYSTLQLQGRISLSVAVSDSASVRVVGNASGGSALSFAVVRQIARSSGARIPILA